MLKEIDKEVARLYHNGWKARQIAERLGISVKSVYDRIYKIRKVQEVKRWWQ